MAEEEEKEVQEEPKEEETEAQEEKKEEAPAQTGGYQRPPREMHDIVCADCGKAAQVPFKPSGDRPVYCPECYRKRREQR